MLLCKLLPYCEEHPVVAHPSAYITSKYLGFAPSLALLPAFSWEICERSRRNRDDADKYPYKNFVILRCCAASVYQQTVRGCQCEFLYALEVVAGRKRRIVYMWVLHALKRGLCYS